MPPDILPLHAFRVADETFLTRSRRMILSISTLTFALFLFPVVAPWGESPLLLVRFAVYLLLVCLAFAILSYLGSEWLARYEARRRLKRIFAADPAMVPAAPADASHRLVCAALLTPQTAVGGILYVQPSQFLFQPHRAHVGAVIPEPVVVGPSSSVTLQDARLRLSRLGTFLWKSAPEVLVVRWGVSHEMVLRVPFAGHVASVLQSEVDAMRQRGEAGAAG